jgi:uncharacterized membrane protein YczE
VKRVFLRHRRGMASAQGPLARGARLAAGLTCYGVSIGMLVRARLGLDPWDVLHQGIATRLGVQIGWVGIAVSGLVLLAWIPLRQRPGIGTVSNAIFVGLAANLALDVIPIWGPLLVRSALLLGSIALNAFATGLYIGAGLGAGARDGLMTGLAERHVSLRAARTSIELGVLSIGCVLGGPVGVGTFAYALSIGTLLHWLLPRMTVSTEPTEFK